MELKTCGAEMRALFNLAQGCMLLETEKSNEYTSRETAMNASIPIQYKIQPVYNVCSLNLQITPEITVSSRAAQFITNRKNCVTKLF